MGGDGVSRFSRLRFLCMPGVFDSAGPLRTHIGARSRVAFWRYDTMGVPIRPISELNTRPTDTPVQRFECGLAAALAWLGARVVRYSFPVRLFHSLPQAGLSRRYPYRWTQRQMVTWSTKRFRSAMISSRSRYVREYRRYQRTHRRMITSSKCRPRNSAGRFRVTIQATRSAQLAFATEPSAWNVLMNVKPRGRELSVHSPS